MKKLSYVTDIYKAIFVDMEKYENSIKSRMSRMTVINQSIYVIFAINRFDAAREFCVRIDNTFDPKRLPKWKGINIECVYIREYGDAAGNYLRLEQLSEFEGYIFEIVIQDLFENLKKASDSKSVYSIVENTLAKWKEFFSVSGDVTMSREKQLGLYGELLLLSELIESQGVNAVYCWMGPNSETHDFYISSNAIEVKTTSAKAPYCAHINSEFQLDDQDINGSLLLMFYALRSSNADGESLPEIIERVKTMIGYNANALAEFQNKLWKYGYLSGHQELYPLRFSLREATLYNVASNFPKVTKKDLPIGIGSITYKLSLSSCSKFVIEKTVSEWLAGGGIHS